jgi:hypothetical protein
VPADRWGYEGRSHSLWWFGDVQWSGEYGWFDILLCRISRGRHEAALAAALSG